MPDLFTTDRATIEAAAVTNWTRFNLWGMHSRGPATLHINDVLITNGQVAHALATETTRTGEVTDVTVPVYERDIQVELDRESLQRR